MASKSKTKNKAEAPAEGEVAAPAAAAAPKQPSQNGVTRPRTGTATGKVWEIADNLSSTKGEPIDRASVMKAGEAEGLNPATIATQYGRWRKFHGLAGKQVAKTAAPAAEVEEAAEE